MGRSSNRANGAGPRGGAPGPVFGPGKALAALVLALAPPFGCRQLAGIDDVGCAPGCSADGLSRLECEAGGRVREVACGAGSTCSAGSCASCADSCAGDNARLVCALGAGASPEACPAERPFCAGGQCVGCRAAGDCQPSLNPCIGMACEGGQCVERPIEASAKRKVPDPGPGDCLSFYCDGAGGVESLPDHDDKPDDGNECTTEQCVEGVSGAQQSNVAEGEPCYGDVGHCDGEGRCRTPRQLAAGGDRTCAVMNDGSVWCWGAEVAEQPGGSLPGDSAKPIHVPFFVKGGSDGLRVVSGGVADRPLAASTNFMCAIAEPVGGGQAAGTPEAYCWGKGIGAAAGELVTLGLAGRKPSSISAGVEYACALSNERRSIECWGQSGQGQLGKNVVEEGVQTPGLVALPPLAEGTFVASIAAGAAHACAVLSDGRVFCWGSNESRKLTGASCPCPDGCESSDGALVCNAGRSFKPVEVSRSAMPLLSGEKAERVAAGFDGTCVVTSMRRALCWGNNASGQLGRTINLAAPLQQPLPMMTVDAGGGKSDLAGVVALTLGVGGHGCGFDTVGAGYCWGAADGGQVTPLSPSAPSAELPVGCQRYGGGPVCLPSTEREPFLYSAVDVVVGQRHSCALQQDATVRCWGDNQRGQRGTGMPSPVPLPALPPTTVVW